VDLRAGRWRARRVAAPRHAIGFVARHRLVTSRPPACAR